MTRCTPHAPFVHLKLEQRSGIPSELDYMCIFLLILYWQGRNGRPSESTRRQPRRFTVGTWRAVGMARHVLAVWFPCCNRSGILTAAGTTRLRMRSICSLLQTYLPSWPFDVCSWYKVDRQLMIQHPGLACLSY